MKSKIKTKLVYALMGIVVIAIALLILSQFISINFYSNHLTITVKEYRTVTTSNSIIHVSGHVNPYLRFANCSIDNCAAPVGIVSYGIYNNSGTKSYRLETAGLLGSATIYAIKSYNPGNSIVPSNTATLQLNGVLVVQNKNGSINQYFLQIVSIFYTNTNNVSFRSSITGINNESNIEKEYFYGSKNCTFIENQPYYVCIFPLNGSINISVQKPLNLAMGFYTVIKNGSIWIFPDVVFSNQKSKTGYYNLNASDFSIIDKNAEASYFLIDGKNYTSSAPNTSFLDAEFVFGGPNYYQKTTNFTSMNATLSLLYYNSSNKQYQNFSSYYNFGFDTIESTYTLSTTQLQNNSVIVKVGKPDYGYVGNYSNS